MSIKSFIQFLTEAEVQKNDEFIFSSIGVGLSPLQISLPTQRNPELEGGLELNFFSGTPVKYNLVMSSDLEIQMKTLNGAITPSDKDKSSAETNIEKIINNKKVKLTNDLLEILQRFDAELQKVMKDNDFEKI